MTCVRFEAEFRPLWAGGCRCGGTCREEAAWEPRGPRDCCYRRTVPAGQPTVQRWDGAGRGGTAAATGASNRVQIRYWRRSLSPGEVASQGAGAQPPLDEHFLRTFVSFTAAMVCALVMMIKWWNKACLGRRAFGERGCTVATCDLDASGLHRFRYYVYYTLHSLQVREPPATGHRYLHRTATEHELNQCQGIFRHQVKNVCWPPFSIAWPFHTAIAPQFQQAAGSAQMVNFVC